jgi:hypothetical protein
MARSFCPVNCHLIKFDRTVWFNDYFLLCLLMIYGLENERMVFFWILDTFFLRKIGYKQENNEQSLQ